MNFLIHYISEIGSRGNIYAGRLRFSGSLCIRVQRNVMSIDLCSPVRFSRSHTSNSAHTPQDSLCSCYSSSAPTDITLVSPTRPLSPAEIYRCPRQREFGRLPCDAPNEIYGPYIGSKQVHRTKSSDVTVTCTFYVVYPVHRKFLNSTSSGLSTSYSFKASARLRQTRGRLHGYVFPSRP